MPNMAIATPTLSSRRDSALQNASSPFLLSGSGQFYGGFRREFADRGPLAPVPPALLPSGTINLPTSCFSQFEHFKMSSGLSMHPVSTPVMHPNLVMTLKSIISPPSESGRDQVMRGGGAFDRLKESGSGRSDYNGARLECRGVYNIPPSLPKQEAVPVCEVDDDEAAVVPVDLIQNRRPFKCAYSGCNKTFKNPQTMKMHHKTHYSDDSSYRFGTNAHVLSTLPSAFKAGHNKKIPSRCPICKKTFVGLYELRRHFGRKHSEGEKTFACKKCGKKFYIEVDLRDHEKLCGEPIECKCGMKFAFKCNLVAHKKGHPECQDNPPPTEVEQKQQQQKQEAAVAVVVASPPPVTEVQANHVPSSVYTSMHFSSGLEASAIHLPPLWNTVSLPQEASVLPPFVTGDATLVSSKPFLHQSKGVPSAIVNPLSSQSSPGAIFLPKFIS